MPGDKGRKVVGYGVIIVKVIKAHVHQKAQLGRHSCRTDGWKPAGG